MGEDFDGDGYIDNDDIPDHDDNLDNVENLPTRFRRPRIRANPRIGAKNGAKTIIPVSRMAEGYGQAAASQLAYLKLIEADIVQAMPPGGTVVDFGCADAINSLDLAKAMRNKIPTFSFGLVDRPENNWTTVRKNVALEQAGIDVLPGAGFMRPPMEPYPANATRPSFALVGGNFYEPVAPDGSVDIAVSTTALHLLSGGVGDPETQSAKDLMNFLQSREKELRPNGVMFIIAPAKQSGATQQSFSATNKVIQGTLDAAVKGNVTTARAVKDWFFPAHARTEGEWRAPFTRQVAPRLSLERIDLVPMASPYWAMAENNATRFAELYVPSVMAWLGPYMDITLGKQVSDLFKEQLAQEIVERPAGFKDDYLQAILRIRKTS